MTEPQIDSKLTQAEALLSHYGFEMRGYPAQDLVKQWREKYQGSWIRLAVIESLYQGRYKSISVEQILQLWQRKGQATYHFNHEFEALICRKLPRDLVATPGSNQGKLGAITCLVSEKSQPRTYSPASKPKSTTKAVIKSNGNRQKAVISPNVEIKQLTEEEQIKVPSSLTIETSPQEETSPSPIDQFNPSPDASEFYLKLKEVAENR
ncbi:MAG: hypothetical protein WA865_09900 [Spirulinaceae cyanobacterium]